MAKKNTPGVTQQAFPVSEAEIQERQVNIRVLTIGTKQVTQTLFRQLINDEGLINPKTGQITGSVWGWVNLHVDCEEEQSKDIEHLHAIWEDAGMLKRATIRKTGYHTKHAIALDKQLQAGARVYYYASGLEKIDVISPQDDYYRDNKKITCKNRVITFHADYSVQQFIRNLANIEQVEQDLTTAKCEALPFEVDKAQEALARLQKALQERREELTEGLARSWHFLMGDSTPLPTASDGWKALEAKVDEIRAFEEAWRKSYTTIKEQGQLFIAVSGVWK